MVMERKDVKALVRKIEELLNTEITLIPKGMRASRKRLGNGQAAVAEEPNPAGGGRIMYVPLPGTGSRFELSPRAQQVYSFLTRHRKASSGDLQGALKVNRNVIAGAVHELKAKHAITVERLAGRPMVETAAEYAPRKRKAKAPKTRPRGRPRR